MGRIAQAFYAENRDMTSAEEIAAVAEEAGFDPQEFGDAFLAADTRNETFRDFLAAQELGIQRLSHPDRRQRGEGLRARHQRLPPAGRRARAAGALVGLRRAGDQGRLNCPRTLGRQRGDAAACTSGNSRRAPFCTHIQRLSLHRGPPRSPGRSGTCSDGPTETANARAEHTPWPDLPQPPAGAPRPCSAPSSRAFALGALARCAGAPAGAMDAPARRAEGGPLQHAARHGAHDLARADHGAHGQSDQGRVREPQGAGDALRAQDRLATAGRWRKASA